MNTAFMAVRKEKMQVEKEREKKRKRESRGVEEMGESNEDGWGNVKRGFAEAHPQTHPPGEMQ